MYWSQYAARCEYFLKISYKNVIEEKINIILGYRYYRKEENFKSNYL